MISSLIFSFLLSPNALLIAAAVVPAAVLMIYIYRKDRLEKECTVAKMEKFLENARILEGGDPSDPKVQSACATMIYSIPQWF